MSFVCLWNRSWQTGQERRERGAGNGGQPGAAGHGTIPLRPLLPDALSPLLAVVPRISVTGQGVVWADARGLRAGEVAGELLRRVEALDPEHGGETRAGVARVAIAAAAAARSGEERVTGVEPGEERAFLAPLDLALLGASDPGLLGMLEGVGIVRCGQLASLPREAVEVRFGAAGAALWRLSRADDPRPLFAPIPRERPHASLDWEDYVVTDPERLVFTANALLTTVCDAMRARGETARRLELSLALADGSTSLHRLGTARPTARRDLWLRRVRLLLDDLRLADAVSGMAIQAEGTTPVLARQGDLFDRGFAAARVREETLLRLLDDHGPVLQSPRCSSHPLPERRTEWRGEGIGV